MTTMVQAHQNSSAAVLASVENGTHPQTMVGIDADLRRSENYKSYFVFKNKKRPPRAGGSNM